MTTFAPSGAKVVSEQYGAAIATVYDDIYGELDITSPEVVELRRLALAMEGPRIVVELGVGTGRVLGALGRAVADVDDIRLVGIDGSSELLARAAEQYSDVALDLAEADFSASDLDDIVAPGTASLVLCVCASFSMLPDRASQAATMRNIAAMLAENGSAVIETHSPAFVLDVIGPAPTSMFVPYPRHETGLVCFSSVEKGMWRMRQVWVDGEDSTTILEQSLLTSPAALIELAAAAGLRVSSLSAAFSGGDFVEPGSPLFAVTLTRASPGEL
ncbi:class I SAM-dependent methyltransferase [uncultured Microbacterium sp.]|uniref:class I SAM-dependent methyltransferase n=1 Tax=uncultured Microbacterium sp. TaxID=191216 RepID=UPI0028EBC14C|nr:class I SAM-dependent methyltransferase [uncultured Microbacterium sp.]